MNEYKAVIGLEMHCELKSNAKVFSGAKNAYDVVPNVNVSPVDLGLPGVLPTVNKECVKKALMMSLVLNCTQPEELYFDRKNYYYPDLPKGYQITQMHAPVGINGKIKIDMGDYVKEVLIHDIHLEEDSASLEHYSDASLINYNRAGVPLLELVTEPCFSSAMEAVKFLEYMTLVYKYCDVSDADTKKGQIRCDVNVSIMGKDDKVLGTKVEIKNVNSFANVYEAINYEIKRQSELKMANRYDEVLQETRRFDEESGTTKRMRSKVDAIDYKYFVEPNIPKYKISKEYLQSIKEKIPLLPLERKEKYVGELGLSVKDANIIIKNKDYANYFEECINLGIDAKVAANWLIVQILGFLNKMDISIQDFYLKPELLKQIISSLEEGKISSKQAKEIFNKSISEEKEPKNYITNDNEQISNKDTLLAVITNILENNKEQIKNYFLGKTNLFDYFVGQVMKETKGKANPSLVKVLLNEELLKYKEK